MENIIVINRAKCLKCGDIISSKYTHDFKTCSCGNLSVDGGLDYIRRDYKSDYYESTITEAEKIDKSDALFALGGSGLLVGGILKLKKSKK